MMKNLLAYLLISCITWMSFDSAVYAFATKEDVYKSSENSKYKIILNGFRIIKSFNTDEIAINWIDTTKEAGAKKGKFLFVVSSEDQFTKKNIVLSKPIRGNKYQLNIGDLPLDKHKMFFIKIFKNNEIYSNTESFQISHDQIQRSYSWGLFYMASIGQMKIATERDNSLTESQNSPGTLGLFYASKFKEGRSISGSFYLSHYSDVTNKIEGTSLSIPVEYGFNIYMNHPLTLSSTFGWGIDFEKMSVFNVDEFVGGSEDEKLVSQELTFFTLGYGKIMKLWNRIVFIKMSVSQSLSNTGEKFTVTDKNYQGQKAIIYGQYNISGAFYIHGFYKRHLLTGPNDLTIDRVGAGFGVKF